MKLRSMADLKGRRLFQTIAAVFAAGLLFGCQDPEPVAKPVEKKRERQVVQNKASTRKAGEGSAVSGQARDENRAVPSANEPPKIVKISFSPEIIVPEAVLSAEVETEDPDLDPVSLEFEWRVNGEPDSRTEMDEFDTTGLVKGDVVTVVVTPFDGEAKGSPVVSLPVVIQNRPPEIQSFPPVGLTDGKFVYQVKAEDPDGDPLSYELEEAPPGMEIDPETGLIDWTIPPEATGPYSPRILVSDGDAKAFQVFSLKVSREPQGG